MKTLIPCTLLFALLVCGCAGRNDSGGVRGAARPSVAERLARELAAASPMADPGDARARDRAAAELARCATFIAHTGSTIRWGGCDPVKGFDPSIYTLTEFDPVVWLKLYASTIMFTGEHEIRQDGGLTLLEMKARFRSNLDPGDYPYPFWHSPAKWKAYLDLSSLVLVLREDRILAAYRVVKPSGAASLEERPWDGKWTWTDDKGGEQPRVALFGYMFAGNNPHRAGVDHAYRQLESKFRAQNCMGCHAPDNKGKAKTLLLLNYPNQSLAARHTLVEVLTKNEMPPEDVRNHHPAGIADLTVRGELIQLARAFVREADAAVAFESRR